MSAASKFSTNDKLLTLKRITIVISVRCTTGTSQQLDSVVYKLCINFLLHTHTNTNYIYRNAYLLHIHYLYLNASTMHCCETNRFQKKKYDV